MKPIEKSIILIFRNQLEIKNVVYKNMMRNDKNLENVDSYLTTCTLTKNEIKGCNICYLS